jgi:hypothetical protein
VSLTGATLRVVHESACPEIGPICQLREEPPNLHDQRINLAELRASAEYGLTGQWGLQLQVPFKVINTSITYRRLDGTAFVPDYLGIHHRNETLVGIMDPWLMGRWSGQLGKWSLTGRLGLTLPLGATVENPFKLGEEGHAHQHIQFGTGTFNPLILLDAQRTGETYFGAGYLQAQLVPYANHHGFQSGHRLGLGGSFGRTIGPVGVALAADVVHEEAERWDGVVQQDGNLGRTDFLAGVNLSVPIRKQIFALSLRTPVYQRVLGGQVSYPAIVNLSWSTVVGRNDNDR